LLFAVLLALGVVPAPALPDLVLNAQLGMLPWKSAGRTDNVAARTGFEAFIARHPGVVIKEFERIWLPGTHWGSSQVMSLAATAGPDILQVDFCDLGRYAREGLIQTVDDLYADWEEKARWSEPLVGGLKIEDHTWGAVTSANWALLVMSRRVAAELGIGDGGMPRSWDEMVRLAGRAAVPGRRAGLGFSGNRALACIWYAAARQAGGAPFIRVGGDGLEGSLDAEPALRAGALLGELGKSLRAVSPDALMVTADEAELRKAFVDDKVAMIIAGTDDMDINIQGVDGGRGNSALQTVLPVIAPVPGAFGPEPLAFCFGGRIAVVPGYISDAVRRMLVWEYSTAATWAGGAIEREYAFLALQRKEKVPTAYSARFPGAPAVAYMPAAWSGVMASVMAKSAPMPPDQGFEDLAAMLAPELRGVLLKGDEPAAALARAQGAYDEGVRLKTRRSVPGWLAVGYGVLALFVAVLAWGLLSLIRSLRDEWRQYANTPTQRMNTHVWGMVLGLFLPAVLLAVLFGLLPFLFGIKMSLSSHVLRAGGTFAGLSNFTEVIVSPLTHHAAMNTVLMVVVSFFLCFLVPVALALVLAGFPFWKLPIRTAYFLPAVASAVVVTVAWQKMYDFGGPFNDVMSFLGVAPRKWLAEERWAMVALVFAQAWSVIGVNSLIYTAGLSMIPESFYEEAELSGAGLVERFKVVTYPFLRPLIGVSLVGWLLSVVRTAEHVFLMTGGGPNRATYVLGLDIFNQAYVNVRFGFAMAEVWLLVSVILALSIYQVRAVRTGQIRMLGA